MTSKFLHLSAQPATPLGEVDIVMHKNIRLSNVIASDIMDSDHLPIIFHILDHVRTKNVSAPLEKFTDWERFQSVASNLISPRQVSTPRYMRAEVPQSSVLSLTLYNLYINDTPQAPSVNLALFADDTCLYATDRKEGYALRKI
jgi:hypothetical protein